MKKWVSARQLQFLQTLIIIFYFISGAIRNPLQWVNKTIPEALTQGQTCFDRLALRFMTVISLKVTACYDQSSLSLCMHLWYFQIHWVPLKTQHRILWFLYLDFPEIWHTIGKNCYLTASKISGKNFEQGKNDITFSEVTLKRNFTSSYRCVAHHNHDMFHIVPSFCVYWFFCGIFLKFLLFVAFLSIFRH